MRVRYAFNVSEEVRFLSPEQCHMAEYVNQIIMLKIKWGEIPLGTLVYTSGKPQLVISHTGKSVSVLDMYHNKVVRRKCSSVANVSYKQTNQ